MKTMLAKITPTDIIAFILIAGCLYLKRYGFDGAISNMLLAITVFYFGKTQVFDTKIAPKLAAKAEESVESVIRRVALANDVDADLAVRVARCESGLKPNAVNINKTGSKDRGVFQWNDYWHPEVTDEIAFNVEKATRLFCKAVNEKHLSWWDASKHCWDK